MLTRPSSVLGRILPFLLLASPLTAQQAAPDALRGFDAYIEKARQDWGVVGLAVSIVRHDSVIFARGFGQREGNKPDTGDERTLFAIGSNSKSFTAIAVGMLQDEGKLNLDDKATKYRSEEHTSELQSLAYLV